MAQGRAISHWHQLQDDFHTSALEFYKSVEEELARREVPSSRTERVLHREGGALTAQREYLRITRERLTFDLCTAPYGNGQFFSWWLAEKRSPYAGMIAVGGMFVLVLWFLFAVFKLGGPIWGFLVFLIVVALGFAVIKSMADGGSTALEDGVLSMPVVGFIYTQAFKPTTYYSLDTTIMYQESVRRAVSTVIAELRTAQGLRALSPEEERPQVRDLLR